MHLISILLLVQLFHESTLKTTTLSQRNRIQMLRHIIKDNIQVEEKPNLRDYEEEENKYLQLEIDKKRESENVKLIPITKKRSTKNVKSTMTTNMSITRSGAKSNNRDTYIHKFKAIKRIRVKQPKLIFYRRMYDTYLLHEPAEWAHCQDMITPFLTGVKTNLTVPKTITKNDPLVLRFVHLFNINTTTYTRNEIYSIMYQISVAKLRLFQWETSAVAKLIRTIVKGREHSFKTLKEGLKRLFMTWRLDFSNVTALIKESRIFRPPCVRVSVFDGSTKGSKAKIYRKPTVPTTVCDDDDCRDP